MLTELYLTLSVEKPTLHGIEEFVEFFADNYMNGKVPDGFPRYFWNRYDEKEFKISYNSQEEYLELKKIIACSRPNIFKVNLIIYIYTLKMI